MTLRTYAAILIAFSLLLGLIAACTTDTSNARPDSTGTRAPTCDEETACGDPPVCVDPMEDDKNCGGCGNVCAGAQHCVAGKCVESKIKHVVLIVQENHTFDSYFGNYCTRTTPSKSTPVAEDTPDGCEVAPRKVADGSLDGGVAKVLSDGLNLDRDPNHDSDCQVQQINGGKMDHFTNGVDDPSNCSHPDNMAYAEGANSGDPVHAYWDIAKKGSLADRYFQPEPGSTSANTVYFAGAGDHFNDNALRPQSIATSCVDPTSRIFPRGAVLSGTPSTLQGRTIADELIKANLKFSTYFEGYDAAVKAQAKDPSGDILSKCMMPGDGSPACPYALTDPVRYWGGCVYEPADNPFQYFASTRDKPEYQRDYTKFELDLANGDLPAFSYIHAYTWRNEHPRFSNITDGAKFVGGIINTISDSAYADKTLVLVVWDEGGGFYDHVAPVGTRGPRVPFLAWGPFVRKNSISHVLMDHSSIVKFIAYNFVGPTDTLSRAVRDANNIGSMLDSSKTGIQVPTRGGVQD